MKKFYKNLIMLSSIALILFAIFYLKQNTDEDNIDIDCIASNSILYVSKTCGHCTLQKQILSDNLNKFTVIDCIDNKEECLKQGIQSVPTWIINNEKYLGKKSLKDLKKLTNC